MFGIDDALIASLIAASAGGAGAAVAPVAAGAAGGLGSAGLGMAGMGGLGAATPALLGGGGMAAGAGATGGAGASLLGTGGLSAGLGPQIAGNLAAPMSVAPEAAAGGGMSLGTAKAPLDYWKLMQYMKMANSGASAMQGQGDRTISAPPAQRGRAQMVSPQATNNVRMFDPNRYPYNTRLSLLGRR